MSRDDQRPEPMTGDHESDDQTAIDSTSTETAVMTFTGDQAAAVAVEPDSRQNRRSFLRSSGGVMGALAAVAVPSVAIASSAEAATQTAQTVPNPTTAQPSHPVMAYVHDARKGLVVIMSATGERTVRDHDLVQRLTHTPNKAKPRKHKSKHKHTPKKH